MVNWQDIFVILVLVACFFLGILGIFNLQKGFTQAPTLTVSLDDTTYTDSAKVKVEGKVDPGAILKVNGANVTPDNTGKFSATINLNNGENNVSFVATAGGKETKINKVIVLQTGNSAVAGAQTGPQTGENLNTSGPAENIMGTVGLTALVFSLVYFYKQKKQNKALTSKHYNLFT